MKHVQIRNVPDELHRRLKASAAMKGRSLSDYALAELARAVDRPTRRELLDRVRARTSTTPKETAEAAVRAERDSRHRVGTGRIGPLPDRTGRQPRSSTARMTCRRGTSRSAARSEGHHLATGQLAVKVINDYGDEVMKVSDVA